MKVVPGLDGSRKEQTLVLQAAAGIKNWLEPPLRCLLGVGLMLNV